MIDLSFITHRSENEQPVAVLRRHWIVLANMLFVLFIGAIVPMGIYLLFKMEFPTVLSQPFLSPILALFGSFYYLAVWMIFLQEVTDYYLDTWILTTERVIDIEQFGLFRRETTECHLEQVVDVTSEIKGLFQTFFKFGNVIVQTAGEKGQLVFKQIPHPEAVRQQVLKLVDDERARSGHKS